MSQTRVYLPLSGEGVRALARDRALPAPPLAGFAVTSRLERALPAGDEEEWEYAALCEAVEAATALRAAPADRRVVAAADVDPEWVADLTSAAPAGGDGDEALAAVRVTEQVALRHVVSFHIDEGPGADGADDLLWYDVTELDEVARL
ncbi:MAG TPA: hypothetical protein VH915_02610, partial [Pedococcus sp.]